jgi:TetR/AcrR family transcriptional regulator
VFIPKETFFNLPEEKRRKITDIAIDEFADNPYKSVSVSKIVKRAGIAKGSFYQYFEDKADLYLYLVNLFMEEKGTFVSQTPPPDPEMGIFTFLRWLGRAGVDFEFSNPLLGKIVYRALYDDVPLPEETLTVIRSGGEEFFRELVQKGIAQGDIQPEIDPDVAAYIFNSVVINFGKYMADRLEIDMDDVVTGEQSPMDTPEGRAIYDGLFHILEKGMGMRDK